MSIAIAASFYSPVQAKDNYCPPRASEWIKAMESAASLPSAQKAPQRYSISVPKAEEYKYDGCFDNFRKTSNFRIAKLGITNVFKGSKFRKELDKNRKEHFVEEIMREEMIIYLATPK